MSTTVIDLQQTQKTEAIKQTIEEYIHGNPELSMFCILLPTPQDREEIKLAVAQASQATGKWIDLIYPVEMNGRMRMSDTSLTTNQPVTKSRNAVLQEIRVRFGAEQPYTIWIIDALLAAWDCTDMLTSIYGTEGAQTYLQAGFEQKEENDDDE